MGNLHQGHRSLLDRARQENDLVVVSIFVNPTQFAQGEDLATYPRTPGADLEMCNQAGVDVVFMPSVEQLYGTPQPQAEALTRVVPPGAMLRVLCGPHRPGHFQGVATVVTKLLNLVHPDLTYLGRKDAQQVAILRQVVRDLNLSGQLVDCPTIRESDGLALSSRNTYLSGAERQQAPVVYRGLQRAQAQFQAGERRTAALIAAVQEEWATVPSLTPQYIELVHPHSLIPLEQVETVGLLAVAAHLGATRLIDNILLRQRQPIVAIDGPAGAASPP